MRKGGTDGPMGNRSALLGLSVLCPCSPALRQWSRQVSVSAAPGNLLNLGFLPRSSELDIGGGAQLFGFNDTSRRSQ